MHSGAGANELDCGLVVLASNPSHHHPLPHLSVDELLDFSLRIPKETKLKETSHGQSKRTPREQDSNFKHETCDGPRKWTITKADEKLARAADMVGLVICC
ncbi:hypothetical protein NL676_003211 [Syzygium grande]|nr:hypothetical protein NL676_003211 [Syzygium grande]